MNKLTDDAMQMANKIDLIQPGTSVAVMLRRLVSELLIQRKHYDEAIGLGKGTTEVGGSGASNRNPDRQSGQPAADKVARSSGESQGEA